jgi:hypothetical protein
MEKVKALIDLSKLSFARYDQRRKYHWQISIAFWALIVGAIIKKKELTLPISHNVLVLIVAGLVYIFGWLLSVWVAQENDKRLGNYHRDKASSMLQNKEHAMSDSPPKITLKSFKDWRDFLTDPGTLQHICITVVLFLFLYSLDISQP